MTPAELALAGFGFVLGLLAAWEFRMHDHTRTQLAAARARIAGLEVANEDLRRELAVARLRPQTIQLPMIPHNPGDHLFRN
jgi:hypothetical protein